MIPINQCQHRRLYKIHSRNLTLGIYNTTNNGFIGIRTKHGHQYAFTEYHWETGAPFGTVKPKKALDEIIPEEIPLKELLGSKDEKTGKTVHWIKNPTGPTGKWYFTETGEQSDKIRPIAIINQELYNWLIEKEIKYKENQ